MACLSSSRPYVANEAAAQQTLAELGEGNAALQQFDVANEAAVDAAVKAIGEQYGRLDVVVNNAAVGGRWAADAGQDR